MKKYLRTISYLIILIITISLMPSMAQALSAGGMSIAPAVNPKFPDRNKGWFIYEQIEPGAVIEDVARVINLDSTVATMTIEAVDAGMNDDGGFGLVGDPSKNKDIGKWVELSKTRVTLQPGKEEIIPFKITVPPDAEVGDHIGGLAVYRTIPETDKKAIVGGSQVSVSTRVGARIYLTIKGDIVRKLQIQKKAMYGRGQTLTFGFTIKNAGNVRADLNMQAKIYGIWGLFDKKDNISIGQVFPKKTINLQAVWPGKQRPIFGVYWASVTIEDVFKGLNPTSANTLPLTQPIHTWLITFFIPWTQTAIVILVVFLVWFFVQLRKWRALLRLAHMPVGIKKINKGDNLIGIANQYDINWKLLAKLNEMVPPYDLTNVNQIFVPDTKGGQRDVYVPNFLVYLTKPLRHVFDKTIRKLSTKNQFVTIIVDRGDTKTDIEKFTGLKWTAVAKFNHINPDTKLIPGQELRVPKK